MGRILAMGLMGYGPSMTILGLWGGPYFADVFGFDAREIGLVLLALALATTAGLVFAGPLDRLFGSHKRVVLAMAGVEAGCFASLAMFAESGALLCGALLFAALLCQTFYLPLAAHCRALFPDHLLGRANTTLNLSGILGVALMQLLTGPIVRAFPRDDGLAEPVAYRLVFGLLASALVTGALIYARAPDARPRA